MTIDNLCNAYIIQCRGLFHQAITTSILSPPLWPQPTAATPSESADPVPSHIYCGILYWACIYLPSDQRMVESYLTGRQLPGLLKDNGHLCQSPVDIGLYRCAGIVFANEDALGFEDPDQTEGRISRCFWIGVHVRIHSPALRNDLANTLVGLV